jgi:hypothetical protein
MQVYTGKVKTFTRIKKNTVTGGRPGKQTRSIFISQKAHHAKIAVSPRFPMPAWMQ